MDEPHLREYRERLVGLAFLGALAGVVGAVLSLGPLSNAWRWCAWGVATVYAYAGGLRAWDLLRETDRPFLVDTKALTSVTRLIVSAFLSPFALAWWPIRGLLDVLGNTAVGVWNALPQSWQSKIAGIAVWAGILAVSFGFVSTLEFFAHWRYTPQMFKGLAALGGIALAVVAMISVRWALAAAKNSR